MGLDAFVYCDCYERGRTRTAPPVSVSVDETGALVPFGDESVDVVARLDTWRGPACDHRDGVLIQARLGNVAAIAALREAAQHQPGHFPVLLGRVLSSGTHAGDFLDAKAVADLEKELDVLDVLRHNPPHRNHDLVTLFDQLRALVRSATAVGKPIVF
jgi:hypothetical protein